jgi:hypothetical protein
VIRCRYAAQVADDETYAMSWEMPTVGAIAINARNGIYDIRHLAAPRRVPTVEVSPAAVARCGTAGGHLAMTLRVGPALKP